MYSVDLRESVSQLPTDALTQNSEHTLRENLYTNSRTAHSQDRV